MRKVLLIVLVVLCVFVLPAFALSASAEGSLPKYVDNSKTKYFPPIEDQGKQNSCSAFSSCYYQLTYTLAKARNLDWREALNNRISNWGQEYIGPKKGASTIVTGPDDVNIQKIKSRLANGEVLTFGTNNVLMNLLNLKEQYIVIPKFL